MVDIPNKPRYKQKNFIIKDISLLKNDIGKITNSNKKLLIDPKTFTFSFLVNSIMKIFTFLTQIKI